MSINIFKMIFPRKKISYFKIIYTPIDSSHRDLSIGVNIFFSIVSEKLRRICCVTYLSLGGVSQGTGSDTISSESTIRRHRFRRIRREQRSQTQIHLYKPMHL